MRSYSCLNSTSSNMEAMGEGKMEGGGRRCMRKEAERRRDVPMSSTLGRIIMVSMQEKWREQSG